jgi:N-methylhydantoinase A
MIGPFPLKLPMLDIHTIGAGGGSIAAVSAAGRLSVGPRSAGAEPGPVAYGRGGTEPTVTDAHLVLGRMPPALLGGELPLDLASARAAIAERIGRRLELPVEEAAAGIVEIIDHAMARAIRTVSVGRGHDPRRFALIAFGGAGPLHACRLAELLEIPAVVIPPRPGVLSTWGLLDTDIRATFVRTAGIAERRASGADLPRLEAAWIGLESEARAWLDGEQVPRDRQRFERGADLRYEHQSFELTCPLGDGPLTPLRLEGLIATFHAEHRRLYSYDLPRAQVELVNLRVTAVGVLPKRATPSAAVATSADARGAVIDQRAVYFRSGGVAPVPVYSRERLAPGMAFAGPAIVDQDDATCLVKPGFGARVDSAHNLLLERSHA